MSGDAAAVIERVKVQIQRLIDSARTAGIGEAELPALFAASLGVVVCDCFWPDPRDMSAALVKAHDLALTALSDRTIDKLQLERESAAGSA